MSKKRLYNLRYEDTEEFVYIEDAGHLLKISGILLQGMGSSIVLVSPSGYISDGYQSFEMGDGNYIEIVRPTLEHWCEILRRTDDPLFFEQDETGTIKAVHRKAQRAISGAIQQKIWARDRFRCMLCGHAMGKVQLTVDHWIPLELGGRDEGSNYLTACRSCGKLKGSRSPKEFCESKGYDYDGLCAYLEGDVPQSLVAHLPSQKR